MRINRVMHCSNEKEWTQHIEQLENKTKPSTKEELKEKILVAITQLIPKEKFGVFLSGGVDSSFIAMICRQQNADFICYSVGLKDSPDIISSKKVAEIFSLRHKVKEYLIEEAHELFKKTVKLFGCSDVLTIGVGAVVYAAVELAKQDNIKKFFSGLGSEEIFAGYDRHAKAQDKHQECWNGLKAMWKRDIVRGNLLAEKLNFESLDPLLDDDVIKSAMGIDISKKISNVQKKIILREIAQELGLPKEIAWRDKKAAQYGSWLDKAMEKLAKKNNFKTKGEYLKSLM